MRFLSLALLAGAALLGRAQKMSLEDDPKKENTYFDAKRVPPLLELTPSNWEEEVNQTKFLMVKHYSPYCPHCIDFAPTFQTLYEFYHTSKPAVATADDETFMDFYSFRFGMINCVAFYDLCVEHEVKTYPMTIIYENGQPRESIRGVKAMDILSTAIEDAIDTYKPGTRPKYLDLPEPGDHETPKESAKPAPSGVDKTDNLEHVDEHKEDHEPDQATEAKEEAEIQHGGDFGKDWKAPSTGEKLKEQENAPKKTVNDLNPAGTSVDLDPDSFQKLVTVTKDPWFIKFYAPWCPHCQHMAPTWEQLGKTMKGKVNIGEVNCEVEKRLWLGDFVAYAEKAMDLAGGVPDVDAKAFSALEEKHDVIFTYFYDHATTTEDFDALNKLPLSLIGHGRIVKTSDKALLDRFKITTLPRLMVSRDGRPDYYPPLAPKDMRDVSQILEWMSTVWLPLVPEVTANNARQVMNNRVVVLAILDRDNKDTFESGLKEVKIAAQDWADRSQQAFELDRQKLRDEKQAKIDEAKARGDERAEDKAKGIVINMESRKPKEVGFAWIDGVFWQRWLKETYGVDVKSGEQIIITDQDRRRYWDMTPAGSPIQVSRTSILETLTQIATHGPSSIRAKYTISAFEKIFWDIRFSFVDRPFFTMLCVIGIVGGFVYWLRNRRRGSRRGGHFRLDDGLGIKEGLMGNASGGRKAD
ncbi:thioredoxin domain-containing protein [Sarocladium implicatum]|nr:thioredoxin domain-containing protein [Sarocladium implicatum]